MTGQPLSLNYYPPAPALRDYLSAYYYFDSTLPSFQDVERAGIVQLRFVLEGEVAVDGQWLDTSRTILAGPARQFHNLSVTGPFRMFGVGVLPAGWAALTSHPANDVTERIFPAAEIFPDIDQHYVALDQCQGPDEMVAASDALFGKIIAEADPGILTFTRIVDGWLADDPSPSVTVLQELTGLSDRQLARKVKHVYGASPKFLSRKYRALRAARSLAEADDNDAEYLRNAFYDQSHMSKELKRFVGLTPKQLQQRKSLLNDLINRRGALDGEISPLSARS